MAVGWFAAAVVFAGIAAMAVGVALLLWSAPAARSSAVVVGGVGGVAGLIAGAGRAKGSRHNAEARRELEVAYAARLDSGNSTPLAPLLAGD
jgi:hypothetical protein